MKNKDDILKVLDDIYRETEQELSEKNQNTEESQQILEKGQEKRIETEDTQPIRDYPSSRGNRGGYVTDDENKPLINATIPDLTFEASAEVSAIEAMSNEIDAVLKKTAIKKDTPYVKRGEMKSQKQIIYDNIHKGHRERVRFSVDNDEEMQSFSEHEVLEYLLFFQIPRIDTNPIAHNLLDRFGSLHAVLSASIDELTDMPYINENIARYLKAIIPSARKAEISRLKNNIFVCNTATAVEVLRPYFQNRDKELLYLASMDVNERLVGITRIAEGDVNFTTFDVKKISSTVFKYGATRVILAHNHPAGTVMPSVHDKEATKRVHMALSAIGVILIDHLIMAGDKYFSFYLGNLMEKIYDECDNIANHGVVKEFRARKRLTNDPMQKYILERSGSYLFEMKREDDRDLELDSTAGFGIYKPVNLKNN